MTRLSHLLFVICVTMVILPVTHKTFLDIPFYIYSIRDFSIYHFLDASLITYVQHTGYLFLAAINPLHAVYSL